MPLTKRFIGHALRYGHPDFYYQSADNGILQDVSMANLTGALHQLGAKCPTFVPGLVFNPCCYLTTGYLAAYAAELFDSLFKIAEDTLEEIADANSRTKVAYIRHVYLLAHVTF